MSQDKKREDLSRSIARMLPNVIQGVHIGFLAKTKLTHTQFFVLIAIHSHDHPSMRALSENMQVSMPTISGIIERLVNAGYVTRVEHPQDRRQVLVELTPQGREVIAAFQGAAMKRWQQILQALNGGEMDSFQHIVDKITEGIKEKARHEKTDQ